MIRQISLLTAFLSLSATLGALGQSTPTAYVNAHIMPVSGANIEHGTILIADGKIKAIGASVAIPANAQRIDLHGATVIPGLIDASSSLFLTEETISGAGTADQNVLDGIDPFDKSAIKALARGVTTIYISPGSRGGMGAVVKLQSGSQSSSLLETTLKAKAGVHLALGLSTGGRSSSLERIASYESLRSMFIGAQQYAKQQAKAELAKKAAATANPATAPAPDTVSVPVSLRIPDTDAVTDTDPQGAQRRQFGRGQGGARPGPAAAPRAQPAQEVLAAALKGDIPVRIEAHRVDDILNALRLADEYKIKLVLEAPTEAAGLVNEIVTRHVRVIWTPTRPSGPPQLETERFDPNAVAVLGKAGVQLAISARSSTGAASRFLLENAGVASGFGLKPDAALRAITLGPAEILGVADRVGSLQTGKDADFVVLSGSPWDPQTVVTRVIVNGAQVYAAP